MAEVSALLQAAKKSHLAGRLGLAVRDYRAVLQQQPDHAEAIALLGAVANQLGKHADALPLLEQAVRNDARLAIAHYHRAVALRGLRRRHDALLAVEMALALQPDHADAHDVHALCLCDVGRAAEAVASARRATAMHPERARYWCNLGHAQAENNQLAEAMTSFRHALTLEPDFADAYHNLGNALRASGDPIAALEALAQALALNPQSRPTRLLRGMVHLVLGDFTAGWADYEARPIANEGPGRRFDPALRWRGQEGATQTLIVHHEQGLGDTIMMARYLPLVAPRVGRLIVQLPQPLHRLLRDLPGIAAVIGPDDRLPPHDWHCPILSLPGLLQTQAATIPPPAALPLRQPDAVQHWRLRLPNGQGPAVGIVYAGHADNANDSRRSLRPAQLAPLLSMGGVRFVLLQRDRNSDMLQQFTAIPNWGPDFTDFADTADALAALDLLISVDTAPAHLAGTLGYPCWILVPFAPDWRWQMGRTDSPWYPSLRLFRQATSGDWGPVLEDITVALRAFPNTP